ncbi:hypothetical protein [Companilactobacillus pabuli]|uniref:Cell division protein FtsX n=1 Tax=Companilactobacillus pabuli TaxID=2714036 RepID=A0A7L7KZJ6_9LACO|nr:hypothetical protein [Companilactobacillus pabuli]AKP02600.1 hypothetical protein ABB45_02620 [Companilactobacillus farciminis]AKS50897.1 hypothetical protein ABB44_02620 [Companilactobacillus farciminis]MDG5114032.1 hypothetical protein [Companilactobacillus pabuli]QMT84782.1 hypothetical protein G6534_09190 [Companilactobacillus pabuli]GAQ02651.1 hypothetical protein NBRC111452_2498 [Companilactobacillus farciminis]
MSKSLSYNRHGFTLILLSICLMVIVFLGITLSTVLNSNYVKKVVSSDTNVTLIRNYTNQRLGRLVNSYSVSTDLSAVNLTNKDVRRIINVSVDEVYDDDSQLTIGSNILSTISTKLKDQANKYGLNIDSEIDTVIKSNEGIMNQIVNNDLGPIETVIERVQTIKRLIKTVMVIAAVLFVILALRLRAKVGSNMLFFHHLGTVGICTSILLAMLLGGTYFPLQDYIVNNIDYNVRDVLYNVLNGIFISYISIIFMVFIVSILDWGSTVKYKY